MLWIFLGLLGLLVVLAIIIGGVVFASGGFGGDDPTPTPRPRIQPKKHVVERADVVVVLPPSPPCV